MSRSFLFYVKPTSVGAKNIITEYHRRNLHDFPLPASITQHGVPVKDAFEVDEGCLSELCRSPFAREAQVYFAVAGETECLPFDTYYQKVKEVFVLQSVKAVTA